MGLKELSLKLKLPRPVEDSELIKWAAQEYFVCFCLAVRPDYIASRFHQLLADKLQAAYERVERGEDVRLIIEAPPQHGKSSLITELLPAWILGKQGWPIICASYGMSLAEKKSENTRNIVNSEAYQYIFPKTRLNPDSTSKEYWQTKNRGSYKAVGRGGGLTGNPGKILIADDLIADKAEADSDVIRESAWDWWNTVFYTRKQSGSLIILVETRWHLDDPAGRIEEQEQNNVASGLPANSYDRWERLKFPAIAEEDEFIDGKLFRRAGEPLCPERFTLDDLIKTRSAYSATNKMGDWLSLYQQNPILSENQEFKSEWFKYFTEDEIKDKNFDITVLVDLAISQKKSADNTCITTLGKERNNPNIYRLEEKAGRFDPGTTIEHLFHLKNKYHDRKFVVGIETVAFQKAMIYSLQEEMRRREVYFDIIEVKQTSGSKEDRIRGLIPLYKTGTIFHRKGVDADYETELLQFPKGRHDDRIDAMAMFLQVGQPTKYKTGVAKRYVPKSTTYKPRKI